MLLTTTSAKYEALLGAAVTTTEWAVTSTWADNDNTNSTYTPGVTALATNGTTPITVVGSPASGVHRVIRDIHVINRDTSPGQVTLRYNDGSNTFKIGSPTLLPNDSLVWSPKRGWHVVDNHSVVRTNNGTANQTGACRMPAHWGTQGTNKTITSGSTFAIYLGKADMDFSRVLVRLNVVTAAAAITWVEAAIATGIPVLNGNASLSLLKSEPVDTILNSTGLKKINIGASGYAGQDLWFLLGNNATTALVVSSMLQDDLQAGFQQSAAVRPSTMSDPTSFTLEAAATPAVFCNWQLQ